MCWKHCCTKLGTYFDFKFNQEKRDSTKKIQLSAIIKFISSIHCLLKILLFCIIRTKNFSWSYMKVSSQNHQYIMARSATPFSFLMKSPHYLLLDWRLSDVFLMFLSQITELRKNAGFII